METIAMTAKELLHNLKSYLITKQESERERSSELCPACQGDLDIYSVCLNCDWDDINLCYTDEYHLNHNMDEYDNQIKWPVNSFVDEATKTVYTNGPYGYIKIDPNWTNQLRDSGMGLIAPNAVNINTMYNNVVGVSAVVTTPVNQSIAAPVQKVEEPVITEVMAKKRKIKVD